MTKLEFSKLSDIFLTQKGKKLKNLQKKLDKIKEQEKLVKNGEITANDDMLAKFATKDAIKAEVKELQALCELYIESNPDYAKNDKAPELTQQDVSNAVTAALT